MNGNRAIVDCWCCTRRRPNLGRGLCTACYNRWRNRGFTGPGPGPGRTSLTERAEDYAHLFTLPSQQVAERAGVTVTTVNRWRAAVRHQDGTAAA